MIRNTRVQVLLAIMLGLVAAVFVWNYSRQMQAEVVAAKEQATKPPIIETTDVLVAVQDIPARTKVTSDLFKIAKVPTAEKLPHALTSVDDVNGKFTVYPLAAGEQVVAMRLGTEKSYSSFSQAIPSGLRAVAVNVSPLIAAGGLILPGDHVDVMVAYGKDAVGENVVSTLLQDVQVLAIADVFATHDPAAPAPDLIPKPVSGDQNAADTPVPTPTTAPTPFKPTVHSDAQTVTLAVTPDQAQQLLLAEEHGHLRLSLRSAGDTGTASVPSIVLTVNPDLMTASPTPAAIATATPAPVVTPSPIATNATPLKITNVVISPANLRPGDTLRVEVTIQNVSDQAIKTQGPDSQFTYVQGQTYSSQAFPSTPGAYRVGLSFDGRPPVPFPYRWGLGADLPAGASTTVVGFVKLTYDTKATTYWAGVIREPGDIVVDNSGPTLVTIAPAKIAVIAVNAVHMRSGPDVTSSIVETLPYGTQLTLLGQQADWYKVRATDGKDGWVAAGWIVSAPSVNPPVASNATPPARANASPGQSTHLSYVISTTNATPPTQ